MKETSLIREADVLRGVMQYLAVHNISAVRMNTGAFETKGGGFVRCGTPGMSDIYAIGEGGKSIWIECKRPGGKVSKAQAHFMEMINKAGGLAIVVTSVESLEARLKKEGWV